MICPNCGARVTNSSRCDNCGAPLTARSSRGTSEGAQSSGNRRARSSYAGNSGYQPVRTSQRGTQRASQYRNSQARGQRQQYQRQQYQGSQFQNYGIEQASSSNTALKVVIVLVVLALIAAAVYFFIIRPGQVAPADSAASNDGSAPAQAAITFDARYYDSSYNPTLYAVTELTGTELGEALERVNFEWATAGDTWFASDGSMVYAEGAGGAYTSSDFGILATGAAGTPVKYVIVAEGYSSPLDALEGLSKDVTVDERESDAKHEYALITNSAGNQYLVIAYKSGSNEQTLEIYNEESIANGLLEDVQGEDATMEEAWQTVAA